MDRTLVYKCFACSRSRIIKGFQRNSSQRKREDQLNTEVAFDTYQHVDSPTKGEAIDEEKNELTTNETV